METSNFLIVLYSFFKFYKPFSRASISSLPSPGRPVFCGFLPTPLIISFLNLLPVAFPHFSSFPSVGLSPGCGLFPHSALLLEAPSDGFNYHLNADHSQISSPSLDLSPFLQSHISFCLQNISTWVSHHLLKLNMSETELIISPHPPSFSPCFSRLSIAPSP